MINGSISATLNISGQSLNSLVARSAPGGLAQDVNLPAGLAGTLTTRTSDAEGVATVAEGHGLTGGDKIDVYWAGGLRYGVTVDSVTSTTITFGTGGAGAGDNLPAQGTAIVVAAQVTIDEAFDGDDLAMIAAGATLVGSGTAARAHLTFLDAGGATLHAVELAGGEAWSWASGTGAANPLTGNPVASIRVTAGTAAETRLQIAGIYQST